MARAALHRIDAAPHIANRPQTAVHPAVTRRELTRRAVLAGGAAAAGTVLAGCGGATDDLCGEEPAIADESDVGTDRGTIQDDALGADWPLADRDPANTGRSPSPGPGDGVALRWRSPVGSSLAVVDGTLYGAVDDYDRKGVFAVDARTGEETWRVEGVRPTGPPAVADGAVVVGTRDGLRAYDAASGERRWVARPRDGRSPSTTGTPTTDEPDGTTGAPTTEEQGETTTDTPRTDESGRTTTDTPPDTAATTTGANTTTDTPTTRRPDGPYPERVGPPVVEDGVVYAVSTVGVHAVDLADGAERWRRPLEIDLVSRPAVAEETVVAATPAVALSTEDGRERWRVEASGQAPPAIRDGSVYLAGSKTVTARSMADGSEEWTFEAEFEDFHSPTVTADRVFVGSLASEFGGANCYALDRESGDPEWCHYLGGADVPAPAAVAGRVYVVNDEGYVQARTADDGSLIWQYSAQTGFFGRPIVTGRTVYVPETDGTVHALSE